MRVELASLFLKERIEQAQKAHLVRPCGSLNCLLQAFGSRAAGKPSMSQGKGTELSGEPPGRDFAVLILSVTSQRQNFGWYARLTLASLVPGTELLKYVVSETSNFFATLAYSLDAAIAMGELPQRSGTFNRPTEVKAEGNSKPKKERAKRKPTAYNIFMQKVCFFRKSIELSLFTKRYLFCLLGSV